MDKHVLFSKKTMTVINMLAARNLFEGTHYKLIKKNQVRRYTNEIIIEVFKKTDKAAVEDIFSKHKNEDGILFPNRSLKVFLDKVSACKSLNEKATVQKAPIQLNEQKIQKFYTELENIHNSLSLLGSLVYEVNGEYVYRYFNELEAETAFSLIENEVDKAVISQEDRRIVTYTISKIGTFQKENPNFGSRDWIKAKLENSEFRIELIEFILFYSFGKKQSVKTNPGTGFTQRISLCTDQKKAKRIQKTFKDSFGFGILEGFGSEHSFFISLTKMTDGQTIFKPSYISLFKENQSSEYVQEYLKMKFDNGKKISSMNIPQELQKVSKDYNLVSETLKSILQELYRDLGLKKKGMSISMDKSKKIMNQIRFFIDTKEENLKPFRQIIIQTLFENLPSELVAMFNNNSNTSLVFNVNSKEIKKEKIKAKQMEITDSIDAIVEYDGKVKLCKLIITEELSKLNLAKNYTLVFDKIQKDKWKLLISSKGPDKKLRKKMISLLRDNLPEDLKAKDVSKGELSITIQFNQPDEKVVKINDEEEVEVEPVLLSEDQLLHAYNLIPAEYRKKFSKAEFKQEIPEGYALVHKQVPFNSMEVYVLGSYSPITSKNMRNIKLNTYKE